MIKKIVAAFVLYITFSFTATLAGLQGLLVLPFSRRMTANIMHSMDMLLAAQLGWSGRKTVSKECGEELETLNPCRFCRTICKLLDYFDPGHCAREAKKD